MSNIAIGTILNKSYLQRKDVKFANKEQEKKRFHRLCWQSNQMWRKTRIYDVMNNNKNEVENKFKKKIK